MFSLSFSRDSLFFVCCFFFQVSFGFFTCRCCYSIHVFVYLLSAVFFLLFSFSFVCFLVLVTSSFFVCACEVRSCLVFVLLSFYNLSLSSPLRLTYLPYSFFLRFGTLLPQSLVLPHFSPSILLLISLYFFPQIVFLPRTVYCLSPYSLFLFVTIYNPLILTIIVIF